MTRVRQRAWLFPLFVLGSVIPVAAQDRTDREVVDAILREGPRAQAIHAGVEVVRREQAARFLRPNPSLVYSREGAGFTEFFQVEQSLSPLGLHSELSRAGDAAIAAAEAQRDVALWALRADAEVTVARLVAEQDRVMVAQAAVTEIQRLLEILRIREREGEGSRYDRLRAEQELADATVALVAARTAEATARAAVGALLPSGRAPGRVTAGFQPRPNLGPVESLLTHATGGRAELRALRAAITGTTTEASAARLARRPAPTFTAGLKRADVGTADREFGGFLGVSLPVPLFENGSRQVAVWEAQRTRAERELASLEHAVRAEVAGAAEALTIRQQALGTLPDAASGEELAKTAEIAYREGEIGILELLDATRTASRARVRAIELRLETRLAEIALQRAVGEMVWP